MSSTKTCRDAFLRLGKQDCRIKSPVAKTWQLNRAAHIKWNPSNSRYLLEEGIIIKQDNGLFAITNLGAILFARKLSDFPRLGRKAIRIVQYEGNNRLTILKEDTANEGYAVSFENAVKLVNNLLPTKEDINAVRRKSISMFPLPALREAIANSLIHQDFFLTGAGPAVEIFENRVEVTNPGTPLVDIMRIVDNPPKSRNEKLASLMRRLNMCEELGRGWDRMVISCELQRLPAPRIQIYQESTKVSLFSHLDYTNIPVEDKLWSTYLHACIIVSSTKTCRDAFLRLSQQDCRIKSPIAKTWQLAETQECVSTVW